MSRLEWPLRCALGLISLAAALPSTVEAQVALVVVDGSTDQAGRTWRRRIEGTLEVEPVDLERWASRSEPVGAFAEERLEALSLIETLLVRARHAASRLQERDAISILLRAEALAEAHLDVPGIAAWYAEVQLTLAVTAAQAGLGGLSQAALRRAASLDPSRGIQAAEARPDVVDRGRAAIRRARTGPRGRFEVRASTEGAEVFVDDRPLGRLPRTLDLTAGPHLLVVDAPGHRRYAQIVDVLEGDRPPVEVRLSASERLHTVRGLQSAAEAGDVEAVGRALRGLGDDAPAVWLVFASRSELDRAVLVRCGAAGCEEPAQLSGPDLQPSGEAAGLEGALAWLESARDESPAVAPPWWERWYFWVAAATVLSFVVTAAVVAAQPRGAPPFILEVDPGPLPTR